MYKIRVNPNATEDLIEIRDYITEELQNPAAALNVVRKIIERYEQLKMFPLLGVDLSSKISVRLISDILWLETISSFIE